VAIHSATKYLSGHGNALGGIVCGATPVIRAVAGLTRRVGASMNPFNAWLLLNGVKTMPLRMERHCANAAALAAMLDAHPHIEAVHYPGLRSHPQYDVAHRLVGERYGGMLAFSLCGGEEAVKRLINALTIPTIAVSLGDTATLAWPLVGRNLVRLSVGLEDYADLDADFVSALSDLGT
jgi:cystathionine beta-lyase/cystathionine gamma-synthase